MVRWTPCINICIYCYYTRSSKLAISTDIQDDPQSTMVDIISCQTQFVGSMDQESSQQFRTWFFNTVLRLLNLLHSLSLVLFLLRRNKYCAKICPKNKFNSFFEMIRHWPIRKQKNKRTTFEELTLNQQDGIFMFPGQRVI